ncbi:MAG: transglutaminase domain-containing protein, partial [Candidatus Bathyarchaeota archaeon]
LEAGNSLTSFYDCVRRDYGLAGDKSRWAGEADQMRFGAKLALHELGYDTWGTLEFRYFQDVGNHSYADAWERLQRVLLFCGVEGSETPSEMIEKILGFIYENVDYQLETDEVIRAPVETLGLGSGDCDDFSVLAAALFEAVGIDSAVAFHEGAGDTGHVMVLLRLDGLDVADPYYGSVCFYYDDLRYLGLQAGRWIVIEPQLPVSYQGDDEWFGLWDLLSAAEVGS